MIRYAISDRSQYPGDEWDRRTALVQQAERLSKDGVDFYQIREKDLGGSELILLVEAILAGARGVGEMKVLLNGSEADARAAGADGVHLSSGRAEGTVSSGLIVSVSCHSVGEVRSANQRFRTLALCSPIFGKGAQEGIGIDALRDAAAASEIPILALGGVTSANAQACIDVGAAGVAGIRMFL
jgi:thiamine-phosphate pyrophosphorylase